MLNALVDEARTIADVPVGFLYGPRPEAEEITRAMGADAVLLLTEANSTVYLDGGGFDAYTARLPAKRRSDVRRDLEAAGGFPNSGPVGADDPALAAWAELAAETQRRHGQPADAVRLRTYLRTCVEGAERAVAFWYGARADPTAFALALVYDGVLWLRLVGLRYDEHGGTSGRYPGVLVFGPVRVAAEEGLAAVDLGAGLADFKGRRGAQNDARWSAILPAGLPVDPRLIAERNAAEAVRLSVNLDSPQRVLA
ncbi:GNAT family N-acetyltransferase [Curtobacterium sp. ISL-83]|uniref:GNAT family N-acetyltransferase n=1 Tax=Curtobacterium sp. ISL-83 TaxID=2819145 RepID=UPI001BE6A742|nr:GNAT family N-acetyltransferase [Curtobacterium sp. ISL-83]MBT2504245.1 GNAT family N-acetyltransferase [Curtobacterium sp. ISL-83]